MTPDGFPPQVTECQFIKGVVIDMCAVPFVDSTFIQTATELTEQVRRLPLIASE
jgi:anti-anti-sigma regulatory factor